jgi:hypothetical protein
VSPSPARTSPWVHNGGPESPDDAFDRLVRPVLVECQANRLPAISITSLTERAVPHLAMYGKAAKGSLQRKVSQAASRIAAQASDNYLYQPGSPNREPMVQILRTPEDADPRGAHTGLPGPYSARRGVAKATENRGAWSGSPVRVPSE